MSQDNEVKLIGQNDVLCRTCRFINKCHIVKTVDSEYIDKAEEYAFKEMGVDLSLIPVVTYCPMYQKHPALMNQDSDSPEAEDEDEDEE